MSDNCNCDDNGLNNTGVPGCITDFGVTKKVFMMPLVASDGTRNKLDRTQTMDATYINAMINHTDASKRLYPIPGELKNVANTKSENITQSFDDGSVYFIAEGRRSWTGIYPNLNQIFAGQLKASRCVNFGIYEIDNNGSLLGDTNGEGSDDVYPITVDRNTWAPLWNRKTDTVLQNTTLTFQFPSSVLDENLIVIPSSEFIGINLLNVNGLIDVLSTNTSLIASGSTTVWIVKLYTKYGTKATGLLAADFAVYNVTDSAAKIISSVAESPNGTYAITISTLETAADVLRLTPTKTGFDYTEVVANTAEVTV